MKSRRFVNFFISIILILLLLVGLINMISFLIPDITCVISCLELHDSGADLIQMYQVIYLAKMRDDFWYYFIPNLTIFYLMTILLYKSIFLLEKIENVNTKDSRMYPYLKISIIYSTSALISVFTVLHIISLIWRLNHLRDCSGVCLAIYRMVNVQSFSMIIVWIQHLIINCCMFGISNLVLVLITFRLNTTQKKISGNFIGFPRKK